MATISGSRTTPGAGVSQDIGSSHPYTCNTCQVAFRNSDLQRGHMRSDWHRYNLKRRVASLPPIASEVFTEKVLQARAATTAQADKAGFERACETCQKNFFSENSFRSHINSSKHKARVAALASRSNSAKITDDASSMTFSMGEPAPTDSVVDSDAEGEFNEVVEGIKNAQLVNKRPPVDRPGNPTLSAAAQHMTEHPVSRTPSEESAVATPSTATPVPSQPVGPPRTPNTCLFCNYESPSPALSVNHMEKIHGMFIPEKQYLVNLEGLLTHLQERVFDLNECITCGKVRGNTYAVQTHMRDKSHCQIPYTTEDEQLDIGEFYDFRSTYSDGEDDWEDEEDEEDEEETSGGVKLGAQRSSKLTNEDGDEVMEDESWETDNEASSLDSDDLHAVPAENHYHQYDRLSKHPHHSRDTPRTHHKADGWHAQGNKHVHAIFYDEYELHLPSGKSVGHRSLNRYFRQNLYNHPTEEERAERLAIQAAEAENAMDVDEDSMKQLAHRCKDPRARGRELVGRDVRGLGAAALSDPRASRVVEKGKKQEWKTQKNRRFLQAELGVKERAAHPATYLR